MRCVPFLTRVVGFSLVSLLANRPLTAQVVDNNVEVVARSLPPGKEIGRLKAALNRNSTDSATAELLLGQARRLQYRPGQVVALCQLAAIQFQQQQPEQGIALLREAEKIAVEVRGMNEVGWAMQEVSNVQRKIAQPYPVFATASGAVIQALGKAMSLSGAMLADSSQRRMKVFMPGSPDAPPDKYRGGRSAQPVNGVDLPADFSSFPSVPTLSRRVGGKPDFVDRWIDTLINAATTSPHLARQLTTRLKIRDSSQELSQAFAKKGDYAKAYDYFLQYTAYKDSLTAEATTRRLAALEYKQNLLRKEAQIKLLTKDRLLSEQESSRQRQYVFLLIGGMAVLGAFLVILNQNNRAKQRANHELNVQKETLQRTLDELKTTQNQLIQSEKMASLGELTAGIAHEIQNPLNFVNNFSEVSIELMTELDEHRQQTNRDPDLEEELLSDVLQNLQKISQHGNRASAIVRGMLEHSRTSTGRPEPTDLNALANEYLHLAYHGIKAKDNSIEATLTTSFDPAVGQVSVIPQDVGRVLINLFNNAFYALRQRQQQADADYRPEIRVQTKREAGQVIITVRDNGTGIPEQAKQKIFQPFFTTKPTGQGTGLGLSLSYDIITKGHGGTLTVASEEGQYTEIILTLPALA